MLKCGVLLNTGDFPRGSTPLESSESSRRHYGYRHVIPSGSGALAEYSEGAEMRFF